jgi:lipopolysaccharide export system permease protein
MSILDRYLFRIFLRSYFMFFFSMLGLYIVIDISANVDEFSEDGAGSMAVLVRMARYYALHSFDYFGRLSPIITQMAAMYALADLRRHNEIVPILAAGVPARRALTPILFGVLFVVALGTANREIVLPYYSEFLQRSHDDVDGKNQLMVGSRIDVDQMLLRAERGYRERLRLEDVKVTMPDLQEVTASKATFTKSSDGKPGIVLEQPKPADLPESEKVKKLPDGRLFIATGLTFGEMIRNNGWTRYASGLELVDELGKPQVSNPQEIRAMIHNRIMHPIANIVIVLLGIPFVLSWERRKFFVSLLISMFLSAGYFVLDAVSTYLAGFGYFDPMFAAWLPIFIFLPVAASLSHRIGT